jgi:taurine dioxygenase
MEHFGAEIDIDLNEDLSPSAAAELGRLFDERSLLVFRNQAIDYETQRKTVALFGNLIPDSGDAKYVSTVHDVAGNAVEKPRDIDPRATAFHSDLTFLPAVPIRGISLYGEDVVDDNARVEGTRFVSTRQAYLDMPESERAELKGRTSIHLHNLGLSVADQQALRKLPFEEAKGKVDFWAEHPLFFPARSGEPVLFYIPWFAHSIVGMSPEESQSWFDRFNALLYHDEGIYTHRWQQNDLVIWDNIALHHGKEPSEPGAPVPKRVLRRAIMGTEAPNIYKPGYSYEEERGYGTETTPG